jgi:23S rRNA (adenine2503-C2)-methyltransferase
VYDLKLGEVQEVMTDWGEPPYRAQQLWHGLYRELRGSWDEFSTMPKALRTRLVSDLALQGLVPTRELHSTDGETHKTVFTLHDGLQIETVLMTYARRRTICISSQVGCAMGCVFCATGQMGFRRNLTSGEMIAQVIYFARELQFHGEKLTNIVVMGMGEPFHNYDNTMAAIDRLNDPEGYNFGARRFTISTVGLVPMIRRFADERRQVNLAVSLHAADDKTRAAMLPVNKKYGLDQVLDACKYYVTRTGRRVTFEWALIEGVNDTPEHARSLGARLSGLLCHVNAIPLNPTKGYAAKASSEQRARAFRDELARVGIPCTVRLRRGIDIAAGCGQLVV